MSLQAVQEFFDGCGRGGEVRVFEDSSATVALAAQRLGVQPERIAKTLAFYGPEPGTSILVVAAGDARSANAAFKTTFGLKAKMIKADDLPALTGHEAGGVCPFANPEVATVYLDESLRRFDSVFPAAGSANSAIELTLADLQEYSGATGWVQVCTVPGAAADRAGA